MNIDIVILKSNMSTGQKHKDVFVSFSVFILLALILPRIGRHLLKLCQAQEFALQRRGCARHSPLCQLWQLSANSC